MWEDAYRLDLACFSWYREKPWLGSISHNYISSVLLLFDSSQLQILKEELSDEVDPCCGFLKIIPKSATSTDLEIKTYS